MRRLQERKIKMIREKRKRLTKNKKAVIRLRRRGFSLREIGKKLRLSYGTVRNYILQWLER